MFLNEKAFIIPYFDWLRLLLHFPNFTMNCFNFAFLVHQINFQLRSNKILFSKILHPVLPRLSGSYGIQYLKKEDGQSKKAG